MTRGSNARLKRLFNRTESTDVNQLNEPSDYVFSYEDASQRAEAKRALSFSDPSTTESVKGKAKVDRYFSLDYSPAFQFEESTTKNVPIENEQQYQTIFTYSDLPVSGALLVDREDPYDGRSVPVHSGLYYLLCSLSFLLFVILSPILCWIFIKRLSAQERLIIFRLGHRLKPKGPGLVFLLPFCDQSHRIHLDDQTVEVSPVSGGTCDEAIVEVHASVVYRLTDPDHAYVTVRQSPSKLVNTQAQLCLVSSLSRLSWQDLSYGGAKMDLSTDAMGALNCRCGSHGIQVSRVEIRDLKLIRTAPSPETMKKEKMSILGKQLRALSSAFVQRGPTSGAATKKSDFFSNLEKVISQGVYTTASAGDSQAASFKDGDPPPSTDTSVVGDETPDTSDGRKAREDVLEKTMARAQPFLKNHLVCRALGRTCLQLVVSNTSSMLKTPLPEPDEAARMDNQYSLMCLDAEQGQVTMGVLSHGRKPDVVLYIGASDLNNVLNGQLNLHNAVHDKLVFVTGDTVMFEKLRHLLSM